MKKDWKGIYKAALLKRNLEQMKKVARKNSITGTWSTSRFLTPLLGQPLPRTGGNWVGGGRHHGVRERRPGAFAGTYHITAQPESPVRRVMQSPGPAPSLKAL